jgi:uncharacterized membrane protein
LGADHQCLDGHIEPSPPVRQSAGATARRATNRDPRARWLTALVSDPSAPGSSAEGLAGAWPMLLRMLVAGVVAAIIAGLFGAWFYAPVVGWCAAALTFCVLTYANIRGRDAAQTAAMAARDDPSPTIADILILLANVASLIAVAVLLVQANSSHGAKQALLAALAVASVAVSWALVHTLYMLRYAVLYYSGTVGGINFNQDDPPSFRDFGYLAFTIGMTYQVSDTNLENSRIRGVALRHALFSFVFGSLILATMVNLVAGGLPR